MTMHENVKEVVRERYGAERMCEETVAVLNQLLVMT